MKSFLAGLLSFFFGMDILGPGNFVSINIEGQTSTAKLYVADLPSERLVLFLLKNPDEEKLKSIATELAKIHVSTLVVSFPEGKGGGNPEGKGGGNPGGKGGGNPGGKGGGNPEGRNFHYPEAITQAVLAATNQLHLKKDPEPILLVDSYWKTKLGPHLKAMLKYQFTGIIYEEKNLRQIASERPGKGLDDNSAEGTTPILTDVSVRTINHLPSAGAKWDEEIGLLQEDLLSLYRNYEERSDKSKITYDVLPHNELIELPSTSGQRDELIILFSGDGGWSDFSKDLAEEYAKRGYPVVGVNLISYFWDDKSPEQVAKDIQLIDEHYLNLWNRKRVRLIGFSHGADVLPFIFDALPASTSKIISGVTVISPSLSTSFKFTMVSWFADLDEELSTLPETQKMLTKFGPLNCLYGDEESGKSLCSQIDSPNLHKIKMPGGHHLDYDLEQIVDNSLL